GLFLKLSPGQDSIRIFGLEYVTRHVEPEAWLKLLLLAFRGIDQFCERNGAPYVVNFHDLGLVIDRRYQALAEELSTLSVESVFRDRRLLSRLNRAGVGLGLTCSPNGRVVTPYYEDRLQIQKILDRVTSQEDILRLKNVYHRELARLKNHTHHTADYQKLLSKAYHERLHNLVELTLKRAQKKMRQQRRFSGMERVFAELMTLAEENAFSQEQVQLVKDLYEFNRDRLRNHKLELIYQDINSCSRAEELMELWARIRAELINNRRHLGREFENLVTRRFDEQLERLTHS
ncbi:MAG: hypothetical protein JSU72_20790, partial [Deltaproteobacteria bacterium]